ncbi:MAG: nitroreductase family deazaflavin-dependent oxidoreductase, partial [Chloroflexi bacterium]
MGAPPVRLIPKDVEIAAGLRLLSAIQAVYERTDGRLGSQIGPLQLLLLRTRGRKSGQQRTACLLYVTDGGRPAVIGSKGGSDTPPAWVLNLQADPDAEIQVGTLRWPVRARFTAATDFLDSNLEAGRAGKVAIRTQEGDRTYGEVAEEANRWGNALRELHVEMENQVLIAVLDGPEFANAFFGSIKSGAVPIPVNTNLKPHDYAYFLNDSRAKVALVSAPLADAFRQVRGECRFLRQLAVIGEVGAGELSFAELLQGARAQLTPADTSRDDMCFWLYSSGTTGFPKGTVHLQHDMRFCTESYAKQVLGMTEDDVTFSVAKLYFAYGLGNALYFPFGVGASTVHLAGPPAPGTLLPLVRHFRPTLYFSVPTSYAATLAADPEVWEQADFSSVRACVSAGEPLAGSILERWQHRTGVEILDGIGSTEICHIFVSNRPGQVRPDSS